MRTRKPTAHSDMTFAPFDVVVVPFPYADRLAEKRRPAVVVSAPELEKQHGLLWLAMITSASHRAWRDDVTISDLKASGLPAPSLLRPAKIATVDAARVVRRIGKLSAKDATDAHAKLRALMAS
jgi:mRNA interferase MazF